MNEDDPTGADARLLASSRARRAELLALPWWTSEQVEQALGAREDDVPYGALSRMRAERALLGVWDGQQYRYPDFQFKNGRIADRLNELLAVLPGDDRHGWRRALWCYAPHGLLKGHTPAEIWQGNPHAVIVAAKDDYQTSPLDF